MRICFLVNDNIWFEGSKTQFLQWIKRESMPKAGDEIQFDWGGDMKSDVFKIILMSEEITGTISIHSQVKFEA